MFNADQMSASSAGAGAGVSLAAFGEHLGPVEGKAFLYLAPVVAVAFTFVLSWVFAKLEQREIKNKIERAIATVQEEISSPGCSFTRKQELELVLQGLRDEKIAYRI